MAEHNVDLIAEGADHIFHGLGSAVGGVLAGQSRQDLNALLSAGLLVTSATQVGGVVTLLAVDDNGLDVGAQGIDGPDAALIGSLIVHGADERGLAGDTDVGINGQNGDALVQSGLQSVRGSAGIVGSADDGVATSADLLLDHGDLLLDLGLSAGADNGDLDAQLIGSGIAAILHIAPILRGQGLQNDGDLDVAGRGGFLGLRGGIVLGGLSLTAASRQGQRHNQRQDHGKILLHFFFSPFRLIFRVLPTAEKIMIKTISITR